MRDNLSGQAETPEQSPPIYTRVTQCHTHTMLEKGFRVETELLTKYKGSDWSFTCHSTCRDNWHIISNLPLLSIPVRPFTDYPVEKFKPGKSHSSQTAAFFHTCFVGTSADGMSPCDRIAHFHPWPNPCINALDKFNAAKLIKQLAVGMTIALFNYSYAPCSPIVIVSVECWGTNHHLDLWSQD